MRRKHFFQGLGLRGTILAPPFADGDELDMVDLVQALKKRNVQLPMVIRFPDIVRHKMQQLQDCFNSAIAKFGYKVGLCTYHVICMW